MKQLNLLSVITAILFLFSGSILTASEGAGKSRIVMVTTTLAMACALTDPFANFAPICGPSREAPLIGVLPQYRTDGHDFATYEEYRIWQGARMTHENAGALADVKTGELYWCKRDGLCRKVPPTGKGRNTLSSYGRFSVASTPITTPQESEASPSSGPSYKPEGLIASQAENDTSTHQDYQNAAPIIQEPQTEALQPPVDQGVVYHEVIIYLTPVVNFTGSAYRDQYSSW